jgi:peptidoglycan/LPS O-acetylase OafA/YrhL
VPLPEDQRHPRVAHLDGLRAVAVLLVIGYHAFPRSVRGGFIGVDVFFVLSGYLITNILVRHLEAGDFSYLHFYRRRVRRIFPALIALLAACWVVGHFLLLTDEVESLGKHVAAAATFTSNFVLWREAGYFDGSGELKPLQHLWSLAVEEQFYLVWPVLLALAYRYRLDRSRLALVLLAGSFSLNLALVWRFGAASFYLLPTRFWEILMGGSLACVRRGEPAAPRHPELQAWLGLALLSAAAWVIDGERAYPGAWALLPTVATVLLISAGPSAWLNRRLLAHPIAVSVGLISYPLYLWHGSLLSLARLRFGRLSLRVTVGAIALSALLAWLTWWFIERPVQRSRSYAVPALASLACVGLLGWLTARGTILSAAQRRAQVFASYADYPPADLGGRCFLEAEEGPERFEAGCSSAAGSPAVLVWGDSFAASLVPGLKRELDPLGVPLLRLTSSTCPPLDGYTSRQRPHCAAVNELVLQRIAAVHPAVVVLEAMWLYFYDDEQFSARLDRTLARLRNAGVKQILLVGQLPTWKPSLPKVLARHYAVEGLATPERTAIGIDHELYDVEPALERHLRGKAVRFVPIFGRLCDASGCRVSAGSDLASDLFAYDAGHLTRAGSSYLAHVVIGPVLAEAIATAR